MTRLEHHRRARGLAAAGCRGAVVGLVLLRRRRRPRPRVLLAHRPAAQRGRHRGRARHLAARAGIPADASRAAAPATTGSPRAPWRSTARSPLRAVGAALRGPGRLFERAEHIATDRDAYRTVDVSGTLRFTAWGEPLSFQLRPHRGSRERPLRAARVAVRRDRGRRAAASARRPGHARPLVGRARLAAGAVVALVRRGRRPRQLRDGQQRRPRGRRRDRRRLPDARRRDRPDRDLRDDVRARPRPRLPALVRGAGHRRPRPHHRRCAAAPSRWPRCASAGTAASPTSTRASPNTSGRATGGRASPST